MTETTRFRGRGPSRRAFGGGILALGGALMIGTVPGAASAPDPGPRDGRTGPGGARRTTLRRGSAERAGLLQEHLDRLVADAESFLRPSPAHPWYAGAVLLAGRGDTVALHRPIGTAVRYAAYDEKTDTGVELPADEQIPMREDTVFDLASVSKLFTSILAVQQIERGPLALEERVTAYLPEFGAGGKQDVTVRQLLTHTSGFRAWIPLYEEPTREGRLRLLWNEVPADPPGTVYRYSDLNLITLQLILEEITALPLDELLRTEITDPLGMHRTRFNPPLSWRPDIAATEDARKPWSGLDRGMVWGEVHDENAYGMGGVAGHAGVFSHAWDLAVLARTLLNGGAYGDARILSAASAELMFTDFNTAFPGDEHGLGFELYQHWYMGAMATPRSAGHTGFTGTSLVLDPTTDSFLIVLGNSVHPVRSWRSGSAPRVATANALARAVPVRPLRGRRSWFSGTARGTTASLTLPEVPGAARFECALWWDAEPGADAAVLEASADGGTHWAPVPFTTTAHRPGAPRRQDHPTGAVGGWSGREWYALAADLTAWSTAPVRLRWRYVTDRRFVGRGVYVDAIRLLDGSGRPLFDEARPADGARIEAVGWTASAD
ncbi:serine hydrolase [Streptomyces sp. NPDC051921]|uniref:serine hydrolase n=1 Tax=Streptomyces sp. NPDC051921 TaxID=3155806 RepID=UPI00344830E8